MYANVQQRSNTFRTYSESSQNPQFPPTPMSGSYFSPVPQNVRASSISCCHNRADKTLFSIQAQVSLPGFQGSLQRYGSPTPYTNIPPRVGTPGTNSKKQQWIQQSTKNTRMIQSGQFQASAIAWVSPIG